MYSWLFYNLIWWRPCHDEESIQWFHLISCWSLKSLGCCWFTAWMKFKVGLLVLRCFFNLVFWFFSFTHFILWEKLKSACRMSLDTNHGSPTVNLMCLNGINIVRMDLHEQLRPIGFVRVLYNNNFGSDDFFLEHFFNFEMQFLLFF